MTMYHDEYEPYATEADAHREWHRNTGVPMGTPGCPQDACHGEPDWDESEYDAAIDHAAERRVFYLNDEAWTEFNRLLDEPPKADPKLVELMRQADLPWDQQEPF